MDYKLNPDAKEFVPVHSPTLENFPTSTTPLSPDAPNFEPITAEEAAANALLISGVLFGGDSEPQINDLNPFGLNSVPIPEPVQLASPSFGMAETPSYAILENIGAQETPLATPQIPDAANWSANAVEHLQDPMQFIEVQFKQPSPVKEDLDWTSQVIPVEPSSPILAAHSSPMQAAIIPDCIPGVLAPKEWRMFDLVEDGDEEGAFSGFPFGLRKAPKSPTREQPLASPVSEGKISPPPPVVELQQATPLFDEHFAPEPQQPDLIECLPVEVVKEESVVLDDILPVEKMIEEPIAMPVTEVQVVEAPKSVEPMVEPEPAFLNFEAPEEPKVKTKLYRRKSKKIKGKI